MRNTEPRHVLTGEEIIIRCIIGRHLANPAKVFIYTDVREEVTLQSYQPVHFLTHVYFCSCSVLAMALHSDVNVISPKTGLFQVIVIAMPGDDSA